MLVTNENAAASGGTRNHGRLEANHHPRRVGVALFHRRALALKPFVGGVGAILTLHHVRPPRPDRFQPNRLLEVTPRFLTRVVKLLRRSGLDVISLDEMHRRMTEGDFGRRFVCLTFDDGYRDTLRIRLSDPQGGRLAVRGLCADELSRPARRIVVARARSGDRPQRPHRARDRRREPHLRLRAPSRKSARSTTSFTGGCAAAQTETEMRAIVRDLAARYQVDIAGVLQGSVHELAGDRAARRRSAGHHRRAHGQSSDAGEAAGESRARGNGFEPLGDRGGARRAAGASVLSVSAIPARPARANSPSPPSSASRPR